MTSNSIQTNPTLHRFLSTWYFRGSSTSPRPTKRPGSRWVPALSFFGFGGVTSPLCQVVIDPGTERISSEPFSNATNILKLPNKKRKALIGSTAGIQTKLTISCWCNCHWDPGNSAAMRVLPLLVGNTTSKFSPTVSQHRLRGRQNRQGGPVVWLYQAPTFGCLNTFPLIPAVGYAVGCIRREVEPTLLLVFPLSKLPTPAKAGCHRRSFFGSLEQQIQETQDKQFGCIQRSYFSTN